MKNKLWMLLAVLALFAAACGSDSEGAEGGDTDESTESDDGGSDEGDSDEGGSDGVMADVEELNVAYFAEWPTPNQIGQEDGSFGEAVGAEINWMPFANGGEMTEAMESGNVDIAYSQGLTPFANTVNAGSDLRLVGIAVSYAEADNCIAQGSLGVTKENAAETLAGATVATPIGNVTHYKFIKMMEHLDVDIADLDVIQAGTGADTAAAFENGEIDVGCAFGGAIEQMIAADGEVIMTGAEQEDEIGLSTYDIVSIPTSFGEDHPDTVTAFLRATNEFNAKWAEDPEGTNDTIATAAGMEDVGNFLAGEGWFEFPTVEEQLSDDWLGDGGVAEAMQGQVQTFVDSGDLTGSALDDFSTFIDTSYLEAI